MARSNANTQKASSGSKRTSQKDGGRGGKKKPQPFPNDEVYIDYKDVNLLRKFMSDRGKIRARRVTGASTQRQRELAVAIKTARELALLPYSQRTTTERSGGGRGRGGDRDNRRPRDEENTAVNEETATETAEVNEAATTAEEN